MIVRFKDGTEKEFITFVDAYLSDANFSNADLRNANFSNADLRYTNFSDADLRNANFVNTYLRHANFSNANLCNAKFSNANLCNAKFSNANLCNADLRNANLDFSNLPLWCGSFEMKVDIDFVKQLLYHISRLEFEDTEGIKLAIKEFANTATVKQRHCLPDV